MATAGEMWRPSDCKPRLRDPAPPASSWPVPVHSRSSPVSHTTLSSWMRSASPLLPPLLPRPSCRLPPPHLPSWPPPRRPRPPAGPPCPARQPTRTRSCGRSRPGGRHPGFTWPSNTHSSVGLLPSTLAMCRSPCCKARVTRPCAEAAARPVGFSLAGRPRGSRSRQHAQEGAGHVGPERHTGQAVAAAGASGTREAHTCHTTHTGSSTELCHSSSAV
jgi:hypothetical protein